MFSLERRRRLPPRGRYSIVLGTLLLPCAAALYGAVHPVAHGGRRRPWLEIALIAAMLPFAYLGVQVAPRFLNSIFLYDILPVPRPDPATYRLAAAARAHLQGDRDAFVSDFIGWRATYGIALATRLHPDRIEPRGQVRRVRVHGRIHARSPRDIGHRLADGLFQVAEEDPVELDVRPGATLP